MRLRRLDLVRYGCFTGHSVDFGERESSKPDFHVVYGPNESGKSTLLSAFLDLMFGIELRSRYGFLHDYRSMRVGAVLETAGRTHDLARIKRDKANLLGPDDQPIPDTALNSALGSIDRASYTTMFSLDDDTLQSGGESILQSQGDLGRLLFSATSGLSALSRRLVDIRRECDAFHRPGGHGTELRQFKDRLADLKRRQGELDTNARLYVDLLAKEAAASADYEAAKTDRDRSRAQHDRVRRLLESLPIWAKLKELRDRLKPLGDLPDPPAGWADEALRLSRDEATRKAEIKGAEEDLARLAADLDGIVVDETILALQERIDRLRDEEGRFRTAIDIPARENERRSVDGQIARLVERLGQPNADAAALPVPVATAGALNGLIESRSGLIARRDTARRERKAAGDSVDQAKEAVEELGVAADVSALDAIVTRKRAEEYGARIGHLKTRLAELAAEIEADLVDLRPWQGDVETLAALAPPEPARTERWRSDLATAREEQKSLSRRQSELVEERTRYMLEVAALKKRAGVADDDQAAAARSARDRAWLAHRRELDKAITGTGPIEPSGLGSTANAFETAMAEDDRVVALRARQSADIARLDHLAENIERTEASLILVEERFKAARERETRLAAETAEALRPLALKEDMEPADLERWIERRTAILRKRSDLRKIESNMQTAQAAADNDRTEVTAAMTSAGTAPEPGLSLPQLLDLSEAFVASAKERGSEIVRARKALRSAELELRQRERNVAEAEQALRAWNEEWTGLLRGCWLAEADHERSPAEVREILQTLSELPPLIDKRDELGHRIDAMSKDKARFIDAVRALAVEAGLEFEVEMVLEVTDGLRQRLAYAFQQAKLRDSKTVDLELKRSGLREARSAVDEIDRRRSEMCRLYSVDALTELLQKLEQAKEKVSLAQQARTREDELVEKLMLPSLAAAESALDELADDDARIETLGLESVELASRLETEDERVTHLYHESKIAKDAIAKVGGDAEVARLDEERRTLLLETQECAERHLRLKIGVAAAERALEIYRDRHRSSMITRAGEAFRSITCGRFSDLSTMPGKDGDVLVGIRSSGGSLLASEMSKGTCFQLYLALRIAGYHEFAQHHEPLPFIADDIMETFDDDRSAEAFQLLSDLANKGQVIYLTHHAHMRDIVDQVCGNSVQVHELPAPIITQELSEVSVSVGE